MIVKRVIGFAIVIGLWLTVLMTWYCPHGMHGGETLCVILDPIKMLLFLALFFPIILVMLIFDLDTGMPFWGLLLGWSVSLTIVSWLWLIRTKSARREDEVA